MLIDREKFLRAALLLNLGGAPLAAGCIIATDDGTEGQTPVAQPQQTSGGEQPQAAQPVQYRQSPQPVQVVGPANEGGGPAYEGGPVYEGGGPAYE